MSKLRVHDLAGEFGISSDEVITLLRQMDVPVRSHLSPLSDDQVARIRARWEREKRARVATPPAATRRRRGTAAAAPAPEPKPEAAAPESSRRRRRVAVEPVVEAPEVEVLPPKELK
ncbi:MAG TPA: translation initiation factor IF-2 N-terminal domain-containing protein, partial [Gemmatimonadaceae bacterium]|nr:translation initiation factor IF-2 N-terminal domain-containing protein [Gemmatimonadaceae bacterium]